MLNGILPLYKPKGFTSHDCVMKIRKLFKMKKVGHTGTLDPGVEGVLPICLGEATKIIPYLLDLKKVYVAEVYLGKATTTEDNEGSIVAEKEFTSIPSNDEIETVLTSFLGEIVQIPPMYSAVKVNGKKLYEYARENKTVERPERKVTIHQIDRIDTKPLSEENNTFQIRVVCSKGTYIRTLCVDIGEKLGYPAHMSFLERTESDSFHLEDTVTFEEIEAAVNRSEHKELLLPIERGLQQLDKMEVDSDLRKRILQGQKLEKPTPFPFTAPFVMMYENELLAIYEQHKENDNEIKPVRVFNVNKREGE